MLESYQMNSSRRPDFVIIGTTKGGTSWIVENLKLQASVSIPMQPQTGLHFFSRYYDRGADWYLDHFAGISDEIEFVGEKSASYLPHPDVPGRLKALLPEARLIAQLRDPVDRAYSDYCMHFRRGQADGDIERYLDPERTPIPRLLHDGLYFKHLSAYLSVYDPDQLLVTVYEEMERSPESVFRAICNHIGIKEPALPSTLGRRVKGKDASMLPLTLRTYLAPFKGVVAPFRHTTAFKTARSFIARPNRYPPLTASIRRRLTDYFRPDVEALARFSGRDLDDWAREPAPMAKIA